MDPKQVLPSPLIQIKHVKNKFVYLVLAVLSSGGAVATDQSNDDERVQEVGLDAGRRELGSVGLHKHHADYVVTYVTFPLELTM